MQMNIEKPNKPMHSNRRYGLCFGVRRDDQSLDSFLAFVPAAVGDRQR
jgi:hypothetical protein